MSLEEANIQEDDFSLAFEAAALGEQPPAEEVKDELPSEELPPVEEPSQEEPPAEEPPAPEVKPEPPAEPPPPKVEPPKVDESALQEIQRLKDEALAREQYTEEETAAITAVVDEFPEVANAIKAELRVLHAKLENAYNDKLQVAIAELQSKFAPALAETANIAQDRFKAAILSVHADAFTVFPDVEKWIGTKPSFLQKTFNTVLDAGTAEEVITLLNLYKQETKPAVPAAKEGAVPPADPKREQKLESQEVIRGRQTTKTGGIDEDDFESAFNAAATKN